MRTLLNVIWLVFSGLWLALSYIAVGLIACLLIVTIPFGIAAFRMAGFALWPFGRAVIRTSTPATAVSTGCLNVVWFLIAGLWLAIAHVTTALALAVTIVGIPLALGNLQMIPITCFPFGKTYVPRDRVPRGAEVVYQF
ncbi:MAG TPA: YccF domain-containing protein [Actinomycetales bacterium]|nr:YccF domain-containing protein [Actinomycetales bacterium]